MEEGDLDHRRELEFALHAAEERERCKMIHACAAPIDDITKVAQYVCEY